MDKHLHKDIGEQFRDEINTLTQQPRAHVWDEIDQALDKTEVTAYKDKFVRLRKRTFLLLLLLLGVSTFSVIYLGKLKNTNNQYSTNRPRNNGMPIQQGQPANSKALPVSSAIQQEDVSYIPASRIISINNNNNTPIPGQYSTRGFTNWETPTMAENNNADFIPGISLPNEPTPEKNEMVIAQNNHNDIAEPPHLLTGGGKNATELVVPLPSVLQPERNDSLPIVQKKTPHATKPLKQGRLSSKKFTLTAFAAPDYSAYRLKNDRSNNYDNKEGIATRERSDVSYSAGILLGYQVGDKITLQSGIIYSASQISINPSTIYAEKDNQGEIRFRYNTSSGYGYLRPSFSASPAVGDSLYADGANHTLKYISIPFMVKYNLGNKHFTFHPGAGVTLNLLTKATLTTDLVDRLQRETESTSTLEGINKSGFSIMLTPEMRYRLSKNFSISLLPYFKFAPVPINKGNVVKSYPYTYGAGVGLTYRF
jgi:hypothetical protein